VVRLVTGTGGGHGDPRQREHALVREDLANGLITERDAHEVYGLLEEDEG
jgi:N-methylhydantoinase B